MRNQHVLEFGADWTIGPHEKLGFQAEFEIDGDGYGSDFGAQISYIVELDLAPLSAK